MHIVSTLDDLLLLNGSNGHHTQSSHHTFFSLDDPSASTDTFAFGINDAGDIVGNYYDATGTHGFIDRDGKFTTLNDPLAGVGPGSGTNKNGINDKGEIVGTYYGATSGGDGFLHNKGGYTTIADPNATGGTNAWGINDLGQIVGVYSDNTGGHGFLYSDGSYVTLNAPGALDTYAYGIKIKAR